MNDIIDSQFINQEEDKISVWSKFIGENVDYFVVRWLQIEEGKILSFNLGAFLFGMLWMIYRKMYVIAVLWLVVLSGLEFIENTLINVGMNSIVIHLVFGLLPSFLTGVFGNWLYYKYASFKIQSLKAKYGGSDQFYWELENSGGVSFIAVLVGIAILFGIAILA